MKTPSKKDVATRIGWLLAELFVVFAGVYLAFWLSQQQAEARAEERRQQIYQVLRQELLEIDEDMHRSIEFMDNLYMEPFFPEYKEGEMPELRPLRFGNGNINTDLWQAMLEAGGLDALGVEFIQDIQDYVEFIQDIQDYFGSVRYLLMRGWRAEELSNELLLPNLSEGREAFYNMETKQLKPEYQWYPVEVRTIDNQVEFVAEYTDSLLVLLKEKMEGE